LAAEEVRELVAPTFLTDAPIVRTSATTGEGINKLKESLRVAASQVPEVIDQLPFRMAIDRFVSRSLDMARW